MPQSNSPRIAYSDNHALVHGTYLLPLIIIFDPFQWSSWPTFEMRVNSFMQFSIGPLFT